MINKLKVTCPKCGKMHIPNIECAQCRSKHTVSHGDITTVKKGVRRRRKCQDCGHTLYEDYKNGGKE